MARPSRASSGLSASSVDHDHHTLSDPLTGSNPLLVPDFHPPLAPDPHPIGPASDQAALPDAEFSVVVGGPLVDGGPQAGDSRNVPVTTEASAGLTPTTDHPGALDPSGQASGRDGVATVGAAATGARSAEARPWGAAALSGASRRGWRVGKASAGIVALAVVWEVLPRVGVVDATFLPPLSEVLVAWFELLRGGELVEHVQASLVRSGAGFGLAVVTAIPLGLLIGWYRPLAEFLNPVLELFRNTAALALLPVFVLILGLGETSKISIILYACSWPILLNTIAGVKSVDPLLIKSARSMGLKPYKLFQKVILPAAVPTVFTGIRLAGAYSILVLVAAEMVGAKAGLGYLINYAQFNFRVPDMYAGIITISVLGLLVNLLLVRLERRFSTWRI